MKKKQKKKKKKRYKLLQPDAYYNPAGDLKYTFLTYARKSRNLLRTLSNTSKMERFCENSEQFF